MKNLHLNIFILTTLIFVTSCKSYLYEELVYIKKGMKRVEVIEIIKSDEYDKGIDLLEDGIIKDTHKLTVDDNSNLELLVTYRYESFQGDTYYLFLFEDNKLIYWGLPYEFANHRNKSVKKSGTEFYSILKEAHNRR